MFPKFEDIFLFLLSNKIYVVCEGWNSHNACQISKQGRP